MQYVIALLLVLALAGAAWVVVTEPWDDKLDCAGNNCFSDSTPSATLDPQVPLPTGQPGNWEFRRIQFDPTSNLEGMTTTEEDTVDACLATQQLTTGCDWEVSNTITYSAQFTLEGSAEIVTASISPEYSGQVTQGINSYEERTVTFDKGSYYWIRKTKYYVRRTGTGMISNGVDVLEGDFEVFIGTCTINIVPYDESKDACQPPTSASTTTASTPTVTGVITLIPVSNTYTVESMARICYADSRVLVNDEFVYPGGSDNSSAYLVVVRANVPAKISQGSLGCELVDPQFLEHRLEETATSHQENGCSDGCSHVYITSIDTNGISRYEYGVVQGYITPTPLPGNTLVTVNGLLPQDLPMACIGKAFSVNDKPMPFTANDSSGDAHITLVEVDTPVSFTEVMGEEGAIACETVRIDIQTYLLEKVDSLRQTGCNGGPCQHVYVTLVSKGSVSNYELK